MKKSAVGRLVVVLVLGLLILAGCASTQQSRGPTTPSDDGRPAWYRISPPGI